MATTQIQITSRSAEETRTLGEKLGLCLTSGMILALTGDLGSGKTAFIQGLAKGLEVSENYHITSPTYTLINEYPGRIPLYHVDLYRLEHSDDFENIGLYEIIDNNNIVAIECADRMTGEIFSEYLTLHLDIADDETRIISIKAYGPRADNLVNALKNRLKE